VKHPDRARHWRGLRQDSGDPFIFAPKARDVYESLGIDHREKIIVYSDNLNLQKALGLKKQCDELGFPSTQSNFICVSIRVNRLHAVTL
jgi:nicotinate phosphoribosyltransferase